MSNRNVYTPIWAQAVNSSDLSAFQSANNELPPFFKIITKQEGLLSGECTLGDFTVVDPDGIPQCHFCESPCLGCSFAHGLDSCVECSSGFVRYPNLVNPLANIPRRMSNVCGEDSPCDSEGFFRNWETATCDACHPTCATCHFNTSHSCSSCRSGEYLSLNNSCEDCPTQCSTCTMSTCLSCRTGFVLKDGHCIPNSLVLVHRRSTTTNTITRTSTITQVVNETIGIESFISTIQQVPICNATSTISLFQTNYQPTLTAIPSQLTSPPLPWVSIGLASAFILIGILSIVYRQRKQLSILTDQMKNVEMNVSIAQ